MKTGISILIPHKTTPLNDAALSLNLSMLYENTRTDNLEVLIMREKKDPYVLWNEYAQKAKHEHLVFSNSDVLFAKNWDVYFQKHVNDNSIVTGYLVECGVIGVASQNIAKNFGTQCASFDRMAFENFCATHPVPEVKEERGWYMPCIMTKTFFSKMGMFKTELPFPNPNDSIFWEHCIANGATLTRVKSFAYHFQNLSNTTHDYKR